MVYPYQCILLMSCQRYLSAVTLLNTISYIKASLNKYYHFEFRELNLLYSAFNFTNNFYFFFCLKKKINFHLAQK